MLSRSYSIIDQPETIALAGYLDGFLGLLDASPSPEYVQAYVTGAADFARASLSI